MTGKTRTTFDGFAIFALSFAFLGTLAAEQEKKVVGGVNYRIVRAPAEGVRIVWKDDAGKQMRTFPEVFDYLKGKSETPAVLMNGGIFEPGGIPSGLLVQDSRVLHPVNRRDGKGNFYLKPNGVFLIGADGAMVVATAEYPPKGVAVKFAVQSGPLLLRHGKVHPKFNPKSKWRLHRNGVGVTSKGEVVFAITDFKSPKFPTLYEFAMFFKDLGCDDALFLDGDLSQMRSGADAAKWSNRFGAVIAVVGEMQPVEPKK